MNLLMQDIWFAIRRFRRSPGLIIAAIVTLALGVGVNTAIFSIADAICLRPLQIADPSHLIAITSVKRTGTADAIDESSLPEYQDILRQVPAFSGVVASSRRGVLLRTPDGLQHLLTYFVSDNYFQVMGAEAELGRLPRPQEVRSEQTTTIILGHRAWVDFFGADSSVIGRTVNVNGTAATVVAVLPASFRGTERLIDPQCYVQASNWVASHPGYSSSDRLDREFSIFGRLAPSATMDQARLQLQTLSRQLAVEYPKANAGRDLVAQWNSTNPVLQKFAALFLLLALSVLLIACANIANLLLALNDSRKREMAMRIALGATRFRLLRQLATEFVILATIAIAGALGLARWIVAIAPNLMPNLGFPLGFDFRIDHRVLAFAACITVLSVLLCAVIPGLATTRSSPLIAMRPQESAGGELRIPARKLFIIAQVAVSMSLLVASGLLVRTLFRIETVDLGFNRAQNEILLSINVNQPALQRSLTFASLIDRMKALPGVTGASMARVVPFAGSGGGVTKFVFAPGEVASPTAGTSVLVNQVDEAYFRVMGIGILQGRAIGGLDTTGSERVVVINRALARRLFGDGPAVGQYIRIDRDKPIDVEIVGIAQDGKYNDVTESSQPYLYLPLTQDSRSDTTLIVTTVTDPAVLLPAARRAIHEMDSSIVITSGVTMKDQIRLATYFNRMEADAATGLGGLAMLLTAVGLFGVISFMVSRRTHEIGIRMALGADRGRVFRQVFNDGLKLVLIGVACGMGLAALLGQAMSSLLFGVNPFDPAAVAGAVAVMAAISCLALIGPARRALGIQPLDALREE